MVFIQLHIQDNDTKEKTISTMSSHPVILRDRYKLEFLAYPEVTSIVSQLDKCLKFKSVRGDKNDSTLHKITIRNAINFRYLFSYGTNRDCKENVEKFLIQWKRTC